jgi:hypothetical protein
LRDRPSLTLRERFEHRAVLSPAPSIQVLLAGKPAVRIYGDTLAPQRLDLALPRAAIEATPG